MRAMDKFEAGKLMTKNFEGWRDKPYADTVGVKTIGYGFNMSDPIVSKMIPPEVSSGKKALAREKADEIFNKRYELAMNDAMQYAGADVFNSMDEPRKIILIDMAYNLGGPRLAGFKDLKRALMAKDYDEAAEQIKNSKWYKQVGRRGQNHYMQMKNGK